MAQSVEKSARTVQQAINDALEAIGLPAEDVIIEVLDEGESGLFGIGGRPARVRVSTEDLPDEEDAAYYGDTDEEVSDAYEETGDAYGDPETPAETETVNYVASILSGIGIHGKIGSYRSAETLHIEVTGQDCGAAIGRHGETLDAIQYLASLVANQHSEERLRVIVDIGGYRRRRERTLINLARRTAERVARMGQSVSLEPMSPAERRIVHSALQDFSGVTTYSEGEEPERHVVVAVAERP